NALPIPPRDKKALINGFIKTYITKMTKPTDETLSVLFSFASSNSALQKLFISYITNKKITFNGPIISAFINFGCLEDKFLPSDINTEKSFLEKYVLSNEEISLSHKKQIILIYFQTPYLPKETLLNAIKVVGSLFPDLSIKLNPYYLNFRCFKVKTTVKIPDVKEDIHTLIKWVKLFKYELVNHKNNSIYPDYYNQVYKAVLKLIEQLQDEDKKKELVIVENTIKVVSIREKISWLKFILQISEGGLVNIIKEKDQCQIETTQVAVRVSKEFLHSVPKTFEQWCELMFENFRRELCEHVFNSVVFPQYVKYKNESRALHDRFFYLIGKLGYEFVDKLLREPLWYERAFTPNKIRYSNYCIKLILPELKKKFTLYVLIPHLKSEFNSVTKKMLASKKRTKEDTALYHLLCKAFRSSLKRLLTELFNCITEKEYSKIKLKIGKHLKDFKYFGRDELKVILTALLPHKDKIIFDFKLLNSYYNYFQALDQTSIKIEYKNIPEDVLLDLLFYFGFLSRSDQIKKLLKK
ncbi:hypothetical protein ACFLZV_02390, partial [Candidatus Margulisiibacteriota bacterium]